MKAIEFSPDLVRKLRIVRRKDKNLFIKIQKQLSLFQANPHHNSLRLHKLKGDLKNVWSMAIDRKVRIIYTEDEQSFYFFDIGTHGQVYK